MALGIRLKQLLDERGITVKDFAQQIGVPPTTLYSFIKRDSQNAKMDLVMKICEGLGITAKELLTTHEYIDGEKTPVINLTDFDTEEQINHVLNKLFQDKRVTIQNAKTGEIREYVEVEEPKTIATHFDGDEYTEEELEQIRQFAEFVKSKRKINQLNAAHADDYANATEELKKQEEDIMDDENF